MNIVEAVSQHETIAALYASVTVDSTTIRKIATIVVREEQGHTYYDLLYITQVGQRGSWFESVDELIAFDPYLAKLNWLSGGVEVFG